MIRNKNRKSIIWDLKRLIKNYFLLDFLYVVYFFLEKVTRKEKNQLLFLFTKRDRFADNSRYLFEYMYENSEQQLILFFYCRTLYKEMQLKYPENSIYAFSFKGFLIFLRTKFIVISTGLDKLYFFPYFLHPNNKKIIQLWHGTTFKRLGFQVPGWNKVKNRKELQKFSKFVVCSSLERFMVSSCFYMKIDNIWITDYPRNDKLFNISRELLKQHEYLNKKTILYAPTWREEGRETKFFPFDDVNISALQAFLEANDAYLLIRGHREELDRIKDHYNLSLENTNRIKSADQFIFPDVEKLLPYIDILITDYSAIYTDYLLLNRPIIFVPYDIEDYCTYRGVMLDYQKYTAGPKVSSQKEFISVIQDYFDNPNKDEDLRLNLQKTFHDNNDGKACRRIASKIEDIL